MDGGETGRLGIDLRAGEPLFRSVDVSPGPGGTFRAILRDVDPVTFVVVGERRTPGGPAAGDERVQRLLRLPGRAAASRRTVRGSTAARSRVSRRAAGRRSRSTDLTAGPFAGEWQVTVYRGCAAGSRRGRRQRPRRSAGRSSTTRAWWANRRRARRDFLGRHRGRDPGRSSRTRRADDHPLAVRHRALVAETPGGRSPAFRRRTSSSFPAT